MGHGGKDSCGVSIDGFWGGAHPRPCLEAYETGAPPGRSPDAQTCQHQEGRAENGEGV